MKEKAKKQKHGTQEIRSNIWDERGEDNFQINNKSKSAGKILLHSRNPPIHAKAEGRGLQEEVVQKRKRYDDASIWLFWQDFYSSFGVSRKNQR